MPPPEPRLPGRTGQVEPQLLDRKLLLLPTSLVATAKSQDLQFMHAVRERWVVVPAALEAAPFDAPPAAEELAAAEAFPPPCVGPLVPGCCAAALPLLDPPSPLPAGAPCAGIVRNGFRSASYASLSACACPKDHRSASKLLSRPYSSLAARRGVCLPMCHRTKALRRDQNVSRSDQYLFWQRKHYRSSLHGGQGLMSFL